MKRRRVAFVGILCIAILIASGAIAKDKPPKPDKPDKPVTTAELIIFTGELVGSQEVEGCCPNAGPFPEYAMTLGFEVRGFPADTYFEGQIFMNRYGVGRNQKYIVQFWNEDIAIQIIGGVIDADKKTKVTTVTFTDDLCTDMDTGDPVAIVSFELVRSPV